MCQETSAAGTTITPPASSPAFFTAKGKGVPSGVVLLSTVSVAPTLAVIIAALLSAGPSGSALAVAAAFASLNDSSPLASSAAFSSSVWVASTTGSGCRFDLAATFLAGALGFGATSASLISARPGFADVPSIASAIVVPSLHFGKALSSIAAI